MLRKNIFWGTKVKKVQHKDFVLSRAPRTHKKVSVHPIYKWFLGRGTVLCRRGRDCVCSLVVCMLLPEAELNTRYTAS